MVWNLLLGTFDLETLLKNNLNGGKPTRGDGKQLVALDQIKKASLLIFQSPVTSQLIFYSPDKSQLIVTSQAKSQLIITSQAKSQLIITSQAKSQLIFQSLIMSPLTSQNLLTSCLPHPDIQASIPKPTQFDPSYPAPTLSEALPMMGIALFCIWAAYTTSELPQAKAPAAVNPEVAARAAEPLEAVVFASATCMVVTPSNVLSACHVMVKSTIDVHGTCPVNELYQILDATTVDS
ncbi:hypothetical protein F2P79_025473 [Pimephales promelas]|nr:hypothetical protein F2P79_025473 [Pimephales promelas]